MLIVWNQSQDLKAEEKNFSDQNFFELIIYSELKMMNNLSGFQSDILRFCTNKFD